MNFNKLINLIGIISTGFILTTISVSAATIFDNGTQLAGQGSSSDPSASAPFIWADDFSLMNPNTTIRSIHWRGRYSGTDNAPTVDDVFTLRIYSDSTGPNTELHEFTIGNMVNRTDTGLDIGAADIFDYSANITATTLTAGTTYWLSIINDTTADADDDWVWIFANNVNTAGNNAYSSTNDGSSWTQLTSPTVAYSFRLDDAAVSAVPVPAAVWLMGSALAGLFGFTRRQSAKA